MRRRSAERTCPAQQWPQRWPHPPRILVSGISTAEVCAVRDHATLLSHAVAIQGAGVDTVWLDVVDGGCATLRMARLLYRRCRGEPLDAVLLHYSVFAYASHGMPLGVPLLALVLRRIDAPVILFAHEFAYPWGRRGWRGLVHAASQRIALVSLLLSADAVVVTTPDRVHWIQTRWWLPRRPVACAPVFPTITPCSSGRLVEEVVGRVGILGFGAENLAAELVTAAIEHAAREVEGAHLLLIGAPGEESAAGQRWCRAAEAAGCALSFTGVLDRAQASRELSACQVVIVADLAGPTSRKTSLAAALAHGRAVIALNGPQVWTELVKERAVVLAEAAVAPLAERLASLLSDDADRKAIGGRGLAFADRHMTPEHAAGIVCEEVSAVSAVHGIVRPRFGCLPLHRFAFAPTSSVVDGTVRRVAKAILLSLTVVRTAKRRRLDALLRYWRWQWRRHVGKQGAVVAMARGTPFYVPAWSQIGGMILSIGTHEPAETALLDRLVRARDVFVDIGANIGFYAVRAAVAGATVVAFEPAARASDACRQNAALADVAVSVRVESIALADEDGEAWFCSDGDVANALTAAESGTRVAVRRLDTIGDSIPLAPSGALTLLKIDAEGADLRVLAGAMDFLVTRRPVVMVEAWAGGAEVRAFLGELGYEFHLPGNTGDLTPLIGWFWQGNIVAIPRELAGVVVSRLNGALQEHPRPPRVLSWRGG